MRKWRRRVERAVADAVEACASAPPFVRASVERGLSEIAQLVGGRVADQPTAIDAAIARLMREAIGHAADGGLDDPQAAKIGAVFNNTLNRPDRPMKLREIVLRRTAALPLLVASRARPSAKTVARTLFAYTEVLTTFSGAAFPKRAAQGAVDDAPGAAPSPEAVAGEVRALEVPGWAPPVDVPAQRHPRVRVTGVKNFVTTADFYSGIVDHCALDMSMLARHRAELPWRGRGADEQRILAQADAICAAGGDCVKRVAAWWAPVRPSPDPWRAWAAVFALGCIEGPDALDAVGRGLERLPPDSLDAANAAAEALLVAPHSEVLTLAHDLLAAPHPFARAAAIDVLSCKGVLPPDALERHLWDANAAVLMAALRAVPRLLPQATSLVTHLVRLTHFPHPGVAWEATRTLALWGRPEPLMELRAGGRLASTLQPLDAVELLILSGSNADFPLFERILAQCVLGPAHLSAVARFGHVTAAAFLLHFLADSELHGPASDALETLFGERVGSTERESAGAWRAALQDIEVDPDVRYRGGEPWSAKVVADECRRGAFPRREMNKRLDELAVRVGARTKADLRLWAADVDVPLAVFLGGVASTQGRFAPGTWGSIAWPR